MARLAASAREMPGMGTRQFEVDEPLHLGVVAKADAPQQSFWVARRAAAPTQPQPEPEHQDTEDCDPCGVIHLDRDVISSPAESSSAGA